MSQYILDSCIVPIQLLAFLVTTMAKSQGKMQSKVQVNIIITITFALSSLSSSSSPSSTAPTSSPLPSSSSAAPPPSSISPFSSPSSCQHPSADQGTKLNKLFKSEFQGLSHTNRCTSPGLNRSTQLTTVHGFTSLRTVVHRGHR